MYNYLKQALDVICALILLIFLFPVFVILAILIKVDSKGPVFFLQKRMGANGKHFLIFKFRSMKVGTPNLATDQLHNPNEYVTSLGKFIRKTSLDELPQLINILLGQMSFVGPRPALYNQYELINSREANGINSLKPGLTGYAQIMGRDFITDKEKINYDKYYLEQMSIVLDIKIILMTVLVVFQAENIKG